MVEQRRKDVIARIQGLLVEIDECSSWSKGAILPIFVAGYGIYVLVTGRAVLPRRGVRPVVVEGLSAFAWGAGFCLAAVFLHLHYIWACIERHFLWAQWVKLGLLVLIGAALATFVVGFFVL